MRASGNRCVNSFELASRSESSRQWHPLCSIPVLSWWTISELTRILVWKLASAPQCTPLPKFLSLPKWRLIGVGSDCWVEMDSRLKLTGEACLRSFPIPLSYSLKLMINHFTESPSRPLRLSLSSDRLIPTERVVVVGQSFAEVVESDDLRFELGDNIFTVKVFSWNEWKTEFLMLFGQLFANYHDHKLDERLINLFIDLKVGERLTQLFFDTILAQKTSLRRRHEHRLPLKKPEDVFQYQIKIWDWPVIMLQILPELFWHFAQSIFCLLFHCHLLEKHH